MIWNKGQPYFEKIIERIIIEINKAENFIWLSTPYLTEKKLINALNERAKQGVAVRVMLMDNADNSKDYGLFQVYKIPTWNETNNLHRKFCIIDWDVLIAGGMNWSTNSINSWEQIDIQIGNNEYIDIYIDIFKQQISAFINK